MRPPNPMPEISTLMEHDARLFEIRRASAMDDLRAMTDWLNDCSLRGWRVIESMTNFLEDGTAQKLMVVVRPIDKKIIPIDRALLKPR